MIRVIANMLVSCFVFSQIAYAGDETSQSSSEPEQASEKPGLLEQTLKSGVAIFGTILKETLDEEKTKIIDKATKKNKGEISGLSVVERRGNSILISVRYSNVKRHENVQMIVKVISNGSEKNGFSSTIADVNKKNGQAQLTITWFDTQDYAETKSQQIRIDMFRDDNQGEPFNSRYFDLKKVWTLDDSLQASSSNEDIEITPSSAVGSREINKQVNSTSITKTQCEKHTEKIKYSYSGEPWPNNRLKRLCSGNKRSRQPGKCYQKVVHEGVNWGGGTKWQASNAIDLCAGSKNANATVSCFKQSLDGSNWKSAISNCKSGGKKKHCQYYAKKVKYAYNGDPWPKDKIIKICRGNENSAQPGKCYKKVVHGGVSWGGGTKWQASNAIDLCAGSKSADATVSCFKNSLDGSNWKSAISKCRRR